MITDSRNFFVGDAKLWRATITKNGGTAWTSLTAVKLVLIDPQGKRSVYSASLESGNVWRYIGTGVELNRPGDWTVLWTMTDGTYPNAFGRFKITVQPLTGA